MDYDLTAETYRCLEPHCKHVGPAILYPTEQHHGDGAVETVYEPLCERCGGNRIYESDPVGFFYITDRPNVERAERIHHEITKLTKAS